MCIDVFQSNGHTTAEKYCSNTAKEITHHHGAVGQGESACAEASKETTKAGQEKVSEVQQRR